MQPSARAVFLDRDGTLIHDADHLDDPADVQLLPGSAAALRELASAGFASVLVTNQSGIARGLFDVPTLERVHARLQSELARAGARLDRLLYCPHHPSEGRPPWRQDCACRKPQPGLLLQAARELELDLSACWVVGDSQRDMDAGRRAGVPGRILVLTGKGTLEHTRLDPLRDADVTLCKDLYAAARHILAQTSQAK
jgi:D-glycero-D-manno-heptose 1,7-bisphosphate phosphatase